MSIFDLPANHEARGIAEIVSEGRPQRVMNRNRIARTKKSGSAGYTHPETRGAGPSATKTVETGVAKPVRAIRKSSRGHAATATVRSPRGGVNIGLVYFESET